MSDNHHHTSNSPLLQVKDLVREYTLPREHLFRPPGTVQALNGVSFSIAAGRSLGVVGESGSGKSTLARLVMALDAPTAGTVELLGRNLHQLPAEQREQAAQVLSQVGLRTNDLGKYPHEFSGGQRQRIAIARALITRPRLIVADEPVSALDVSVQAQVLNLMQDLQQQFGITYMLISHDLAVVNHLCDEVVVLYQGRIVERGSPGELFRNAQHPYTQSLVGAVPQVQPGRARARRTAAAAAAVAAATAKTA